MPKAKKEKTINEKVEKAIKKAVSKKDESSIAIELIVNLQTIKEEINDIQAFILANNPTVVKTQTIIRATYGSKTVERVFNIAFARRLFTNPLTALVFERNIRLALGAPAK